MKLLNQFTTMTNNGIWTVGPSDDPKMHARISEGGFALLKAKAAPAGWEKRLSGTNGREFLHNPATGQSQWPKTGASYEKQASIQAHQAWRELARGRAVAHVVVVVAELFSMMMMMMMMSAHF